MEPVIQTMCCGVRTRAVLVSLEMPNGGASAHGDQLGPQLHRLLEHQQDPQGFEGTAARMPDRREGTI